MWLTVTSVCSSVTGSCQKGFQEYSFCSSRWFPQHLDTKGQDWGHFTKEDCLSCGVCPLSLWVY